MLKLAVVGKDVSESQSPEMHTFILRALGKECDYKAVSIPPEEFTSRAEGLFEAYDAFNVTIPLTIDGTVLARILAEIQWTQNAVYVRNLGMA